MNTEVPSSISESNLEGLREGKEPWAKPQIQELEARQGTLGGSSTGGEDTFLFTS